MRILLFIACHALAILPCRAQIYDFHNTEVPTNKSLHTLYAYYVYSTTDAPKRIGTSTPDVEFTDLVLSGSTSASIQMSIMRYQDFWTLINPYQFCSSSEDVANGKAERVNELMVQKSRSQKLEDVDTYVHTVPTGAPKNVRRDIHATGIYILVFSNCGDTDNGVVSGKVAVKNAYGYLPGIEYNKMPFYLWLFAIYVVLNLFWFFLSLRWWKQLFNIQKCIGAVLFIGMVECILWYAFLNDWNNTGRRGRMLFVLAVAFTVAKSVFSYMLVLVASLGWGVTRPFLDKGTTMKIQALSFLYIVLDIVREYVLSFRHSHSISFLFVVLCLLPVSLMNGLIFYWVFTALSNLMETLQERRQTEKLALFQKLWTILVIALTLAAIALLFQFFDMSRDNYSARWKYQWLFADAVSHALFLGVLICIMYLWAPHAESQRYTYSEQLDMEMEGQGAIWADEDVFGEDNDDPDSFWAATREEEGGAFGMNADVIGKKPTVQDGSSRGSADLL
eukprot:TRINITY_DN16336_c0_g1_i1.p1 TRINITY_DN16336_c0_g1~~TRINITY_DN16336_c0_g1_i1.p1  ORF type:complete len:505 (-),score=59.27 TRINITY_DN16336_c0_g1_i1:95-1609(-)